jgi:hypothetical protein
MLQRFFNDLISKLEKFDAFLDKQYEAHNGDLAKIVNTPFEVPEPKPRLRKTKPKEVKKGNKPVENISFKEENEVKVRNPDAVLNMYKHGRPSEQRLSEFENAKP